MAYDNNRFCWHGVISTDPEKAAAFYTSVLGWGVLKQPMGDTEGTMFTAGGVPRAHVMAPPMEGVPSHWDNYLRVDDVDARTQACVAAGGAVMVPPTDIPVGRFSVVTSPSGAAISLFHESDEAGATHAPDGDGSICWTELHSKDVDADLAWLKTALGFETQEMPMPEGPYHLLVQGESQRGGVMVSQHDQAPSMWLSWVQVANVDETLELATANGGNVLAPAFEVPVVGRLGIIADSTGGVFGVMTPPAQG